MLELDATVKQLIDQEDELIKEAISHVLGTTDWDIPEIKDRCMMEHIPYDGEKSGRYFVMDGVQLLYFHTGLRGIGYKKLWEESINKKDAK